MLDKLLESKQTRGWASGSAIVSITAHTALIAAAVYATAQARVQPVRRSYVVTADYVPRIAHAAQPTPIILLHALSSSTRQAERPIA